MALLLLYEQRTDSVQAILFDKVYAALEEAAEGFAFEQSVLQEGEVDELMYDAVAFAIVCQNVIAFLFLGGDVVVGLGEVVFFSLRNLLGLLLALFLP